MPLYSARCSEHGDFDALVKWDEVIPCPTCGLVSKRLVSMPAKTATLWTGGWRQGLSGSGFWSHSVGGRVSDKRDEERIMRSRGKVNVKDLGGEAFEDSFMSAKRREANELDATARTYTDNLQKFGGDKARAVVETFPAKQMLAEAAAHDTKS